MISRILRITGSVSVLCGAFAASNALAQTTLSLDVLSSRPQLVSGANGGGAEDASDPLYFGEVVAHPGRVDVASRSLEVDGSAADGAFQEAGHCPREVGRELEVVGLQHRAVAGVIHHRGHGWPVGDSQHTVRAYTACAPAVRSA